MKYLLTFLLLTSLAHATPRVGVSFNQYKPSDNFTTTIDFAHILTENSPPMNWPKFTAKVAKRVQLEAGGIDRDQLLTGWGVTTPTLIKEIESFPAPFKQIMAYYENPPGQTFMTPPDINTAYYMAEHPLLLLYRTFDTGYLNNSIRLFPKEKVPGAVFEFMPLMKYVKDQKIGKWIDWMVNHDRVPYLLIPPGEPGPYVHRCINALTFIKGESKNFDKAVIIFAVYERGYTGVTFKQVESAIRVFRYNF